MGNSPSPASKTDYMLWAGRYQMKEVLRSVVNVEKAVLGEGMSGEVRLANHRQGGPPVALKMFNVRCLPNKKLELLQAELDVHLAVDHPNIARLLNVYETRNGDVHLILEYLQGGDLFTRLSERRTFAEEDAADAMQQMLFAVAYLHAHQVVHRDIKLENFIFEAEGGSHLKMIDFGLSTRWGAEEQVLTHVCGSPDYIAPEVLSRSYTEKADIWPLGVIAYTLLCGVLPWEGGSEKHGVRRGKPYLHPPLFDRLSKDARSFVRSLLVAKHEERPSAASSLQHPWLLGLTRCGRHGSNFLDRSAYSKLRSFTAEPPLKRLFMSFAAWSLPLRQQQPIREQFIALCSESCGAIRREDFLRAVAAQNLAADEAEVLFELLDANDDGEISYSEFLAAMQASGELERDTVCLTFSRFDVDGDGEISVGDLKAVLDSEGSFLGTSAEDIVAAGGRGGGGATGISLCDIEGLLKQTSPSSSSATCLKRRRQHHRQTPATKACWPFPTCFAWCRS